jgi:hypothetical protein
MRIAPVKYWLRYESHMGTAEPTEVGVLEVILKVTGVRCWLD